MLLLAAAVTANAAHAEPKATIILKSQHDLDFTDRACDALVKFTDVEAVTRLVKNASADDQSVKYNRQLLNGIAECKTVSDPRELGRRYEQQIVELIAKSPHCAGISTDIEGHDKYDGKPNEAALAAERKEHWLLLVDHAPGNDTNAWSLFPENLTSMPRPPADRLLGEGTTAEIVDQVCGVVSGKGPDGR
jgi:hypothetical protein